MARERAGDKPAQDTKLIDERKPLVTIDYRCFPHIIDLILSSLSYVGLIVCSAVCKDWRSQLRRRLFKHVAVFDSILDDETTVVRSRSLDCPKTSAVLAINDASNVDDFRNVFRSTTVDYYRSYEAYNTWKIFGPTSC